jgi:hypothetical protein
MTNLRKQLELTTEEICILRCGIEGRCLASDRKDYCGYFYDYKKSSQSQLDKVFKSKELYAHTTEHWREYRDGYIPLSEYKEKE